MARLRTNEKMLIIIADGLNIIIPLTTITSVIVLNNTAKSFRNFDADK
jgi:hypothetical protein